MKRLLAMMLAWFTSMFNNVDYQMRELAQFEADSYFIVEEASEPDYRDLYGSNPVASRQVACTASMFPSNFGKLVSYTTSSSTKGYWIENNISMKEADLPSSGTFTFTRTCDIIVPYTATLETSSVTGDGRSMLISIDLNGTTYKVQFNKMERWWCCYGKSNPDTTDSTGEDVWIHTCDELKGKRLTQGYVLGKAEEGITTCHVFKGEDVISLKEFYTQIVP